MKKTAKRAIALAILLAVLFLSACTGGIKNSGDETVKNEETGNVTSEQTTADETKG